jgi:diguanylate cyclase (GGDEF)-like protein/PAS domain S-box-containing protein
MMTMRFRKISLRTKTILALASGLVAFSAILTGMQYQISSRTLTAEWESKAVEFARILEFAVQPLLERRDNAGLARAVSHTLLIPEIKSITVVDPEGIIVADSSEQGIGGRLVLHLDAVRQALEEAKTDISWVEKRDYGRVRYILTPVKARSENTAKQARVDGAILIGMDLSVMDGLIQANLYYLLFVNGVTFAALLVMFWVAIRIGLVQPLSTLAKAMRAAPGAPLSDRGSAMPSDEISTLTETFAQMTESLHESDEFNRAILGSLEAHTAVLDTDGHLLTVNAAWERFAKEHNNLFPSTGGGLVNYLDVCREGSGYGGHGPEVVAGIQAVLNGSRPDFRLEYLCPLPKGPRWFLFSATPLTRKHGGAIVSHRDITDRKRAEETLREAQTETEQARTRLDALYDTVPIGLMYVTADLVVERVSQSIADLHGRSVEDHLQQWLPNSIPSDRWMRLRPIFEQVLQSGKPYYGFEEEIPDARVPGGVRFLLSDYYPDLNEKGTVRGIHVTTQDITAQTRAQQEHEQHLKELTAKNRELDQMAIRDPLTGLYNRRFFDEALTREWQQFQRSGEAFTVIIMDVDAFKTINDEYGHETGDRALQQAATTLRINLRESDLVARVGGDEFAALLPRTDTEHSEQVSEKLRDVLRKLRLTTSTGEIAMSVSIGSATVPGFPPVSSAAELLRVADKRMYDAKRLASSGRPDAG